MTQATLNRLAEHDWPGNIRELQNAVERAVIVSQRGPLQFELPGLASSQSTTFRRETSQTNVLLTRDELKSRERDSIVAALQQTGGKVFGPGGAAELLGMKPTTLASRIKALGLRRKTPA